MCECTPHVGHFRTGVGAHSHITGHIETPLNYLITPLFISNDRKSK